MSNDVSCTVTAYGASGDVKRFQAAALNENAQLPRRWDWDAESRRPVVAEWTKETDALDWAKVAPKSGQKSKWPAREVETDLSRQDNEDGTVEYEIVTPNSPPLEAVKEMAERYPDVGFTLDWIEPNGPESGRLQCYDGEVIEYTERLAGLCSCGCGQTSYEITFSDGDDDERVLEIPGHQVDRLAELSDLYDAGVAEAEAEAPTPAVAI